MHYALAFTLAVGAPALAYGEDAAQPTQQSAQSQAVAKPAPKPMAGMIRYPKPVVRNGKVYLWRGAWRAQAGAGKSAAARPAASKAGATFTILVDGADLEGQRAASELGGVLAGGSGGVVKPVLGKTSPSALAKAAAGDSVDFALAPLDLVESTDGGGDWRRRVSYVARLYNENIELIAPRAIGDVRQLAGHKVNVDAADGATAASAKIIFAHLNVSAAWTNYPLSEALQRLARGEIDAVLTVGGGNSKAVASFGDDGRFHLVAIPYAPVLRAYYAPQRLTAEDYPKLIAAGEKVDTLSAPLVLLAMDGALPARAQPLTPLTERFFENFESLLDDTKDPRWREVNLAATVDQLQRFGAAQAWLDKNKAGTSADFEAFRNLAEAANASSDGPTGADSDRLYQGLMRLSGAGR